MIKKLVAIVLIVLFGYFVIFVVPSMIRNRKSLEQQKAAELEEKAQRHAQDTIGDKLGITGGSAGFGGIYTEKAMKNQSKASNRSADYLEQNEKPEEEEPEQ